MKRVIVLLLTVALALSSSVTAFAEDIIIIADDNGPQAPTATGDSWENLTYKGGLSAYQKLIGSVIQVFSSSAEEPVTGPIVIKGYVVGTPYVPPASTTDTPAEEKEEEEEPVSETEQDNKQEESTEAETENISEQETTQANLSTAEISTISTDVLSMLKFAVSTREDSKVAKYTLPTQEEKVSTYFSNRNADILKLDDKSEVKTGIQAIKTLMPTLIKADKAKVENVNIVSSDEVSLNVTVPVYAAYKTMSEDMLKQVDKDLDVSTLGSIGEILSDPLKARSTVDATQYSAAMTFFSKFGTAIGSKDLYTSNPELYETGTMTITLRKVDNAWKVDAATAIINAKIDGVDTQIYLIPLE
ncbi:hypothetical protein B5F10_02820 [Anaerotruncus colihominis]|uniref:Uncharacterized protein n=1 Tax=Anaerotruncus colihominis TaxID=169435 RepID=A0A1Y4MUL0_9FIRM|nr:hypothetical protein [Anaerotruncus colihominis]OUP70572.1 hypothetical protein B5F11_03800 [Anaerotruncus colihominis]OUP76092.1 hypothetical protein B5F10_02820 [Anaerotruncus colihominis]